MEAKRKKFKRVVPDEVRVEDLTPLDVVCGTTKCTEGYHCYSQKKTSLKKFGKERVCKECGTDLIDWERIHQNDLTDSKYVFDSLRTEIIRHVFWHTEIEPEAKEKALKLGLNGVIASAQKLLKTRIGKYNAYMDGRQTPMGKDEIVNYAQHATATCCRKCLEAWHNIPMENTLSEAQLAFCVDLVGKFVIERLPELVSEHAAEKFNEDATDRY